MSRDPATRRRQPPASDKNSTADSTRPAANGLSPTFVERILGVLPLPYWAGALIVSAFLSPVPVLLAGMIQGSNWQPVFQSFFGWPLEPTPPQAIAGVLLWWLHPFYAFWIIAVIRRRVLAAESSVAPLLPEGVPAYRRLFAGAFRASPALVTGAVLAAMFSGLIAGEMSRVTAVMQSFILIRYIVLFVVYGTSIWMYLAVLWGLVRLGRQPLRFKPFYEDRMLGTRPVGSLALVVTFTFLGNLGLVVLIALVMPTVFALGATIVGLTMLGSAFFFLSLYAVHGQMAAEKDRCGAALRERWVHATGITAAPAGPDSPAGRRQPPAPEGGAPEDARPPELASLLTDLRDLLALQAAERQVAAIAKWPFDLEVVGGLAAIITAILTGVLTDIITGALGV